MAVTYTNHNLLTNFHQNPITNNYLMKHIVILGAGTAGTMMANHLRKELDLANRELLLVCHGKTNKRIYS